MYVSGVERKHVFNNYNYRNERSYCKLITVNFGQVAISLTLANDGLLGTTGTGRDVPELCYV